MPSLNDLPELNEETVKYADLLDALSNMTTSDLLDNLALSVAQLLAYEGADISAETLAISSAVDSIRAKLSELKPDDESGK